MSDNYVPESFSVVIPVWKCAECLTELTARIITVLEHYTQNIEIIFVDDHSPDNSWQIIQALRAKDNRIKGIRLSKNFGQYPATQAGLKLASADWIIVMDCDLQNLPEELPTLIDEIPHGYQVIRAKRQNRGDSWHRKFFSKLFYRMFAYLTNSKQDSGLTNFGVYSKQAIQAVLSMGDYIKFFPVFVSWIGFKSTVVNVRHPVADTDEKSSYSFSKLLTLAINVIISFSDKPLLLIIKTGLTFIALSLLAVLFTLMSYWMGNYDVRGYTSIMLSIWLLGSILIFLLGVVGLYVAKSFDQVKSRPVYLIEEKEFDDHQT
jgi:polyisoprenyl-phosphate glycosyltransferase